MRTRRWLSALAFIVGAYFVYESFTIVDHPQEHGSLLHLAATIGLTASLVMTIIGFGGVLISYACRYDDDGALKVKDSTCARVVCCGMEPNNSFTFSSFSIGSAVLGILVISGALAFLGYGYFADPTSPLGRFATYVFVMLALGIPVGLITSYFVAKLMMRDPDDARK